MYLAKIENSGKVTTPELEKYVSTHWVDVTCCRNNDFDSHVISRAKMILTEIENATGKTIFGKDSEEVIKSFGKTLL